MPIHKSNFLEGEDNNGMQNASSKKTLPIILGVFLVITLIGAGYLYKQLDTYKSDPKAILNQEATDLVQKVGKILVLPTGEQPTIATVTDVEKLRSQPFFTNAKLGDKVLIYTNARKAILYNPTDNKVVEVAPLNIGATATK